MAKSLIKKLQVMVLTMSLLVPMITMAAEQVETRTGRPGYIPVMADALLVRPVTFVATIFGGVVWVATLPFTAPTGTMGEAAMTLVVDPAATTFMRCLGCKEVGWRKLPKEGL
jgi:hypothetical protein